MILKSESSYKDILKKANVVRINDVPVSQFMNSRIVTLRDNFTLKTTIETFRVRKISGAPVVNSSDKIIGVISEYDLLIQAASKSLSAPIEYNGNVISVSPETTLKDVLVTLYKQRLKWMPVVSKENFVVGVISRIDVLHFIASHSDL